MESVCKSLRDEGYWTEATVLEDPALSTWVQAHFRAALTPFSGGYPFRWLETLGLTAPPALWRRSISCMATANYADIRRNRPIFRKFLDHGAGASSNHGEYSGLNRISRHSCPENPCTLENLCPVRYVGVVGGRFVSPKDLDFAFRAGIAIGASEYTLVSGGAQGCDSAALNGCIISQLRQGHWSQLDDRESVDHNESPKSLVPPLLLFPFGLDRLLDDDGQPGRTATCYQLENGPIEALSTANSRDHLDQLDEVGLGFQETVAVTYPSGTVVATSLRAPFEEFSTSAAMERNRLIYAASEATLVVRARHREGGSWHGAITALRDRLCPVFIQEDPSSLAHRTLIALGAIPLRDPDALVAQVQNVGCRSGAQATLF